MKLIVVKKLNWHNGLNTTFLKAETQEFKELEKNTNTKNKALPIGKGNFDSKQKKNYNCCF
jgi:hypothetical protein